MLDMRGKIKEYIEELEEEIERCIEWITQEKSKIIDVNELECFTMESRIETLMQVENDLKNRLEELI